jgi:hypothetical protein
MSTAVMSSENRFSRALITLWRTFSVTECTAKPYSITRCSVTVADLPSTPIARVRSPSPVVSVTANS